MTERLLRSIRTATWIVAWVHILSIISVGLIYGLIGAIALGVK